MTTAPPKSIWAPDQSDPGRPPCDHALPVSLGLAMNRSARTERWISPVAPARLGDRAIARPQFRLEHGCKAMLDGAADILMRLDIRSEIVGTCAPEARCRVE